MPKRVTIADVAQLADVHPGTASRALNEKTASQVNPATAKRVRRAANQLGYTPNAVARGLRMSSSMTIGVIVPDLTNPIFPPIVRGIDSCLAPRGYSALVVNTDGSDANERVLFASLMERQVDGFIIATGHTDHPLLAEAYERGVRAVMVNRDSGNVPYSAVTGDDAKGIKAVVGHLVGLGHRRIVHMAGPPGFSTSEIREDAFSAACAEYGVTGDVVEASAYSTETGRMVMDAILQRQELPTAVVAGNDLLALGVYHSLRAHGLSCPDDMSVVGFNDMPFAGDFNPPLTTVHAPYFEMGVESARLLLSQIDNSASTALRVMLPVSLVVRESTGRPANRRESP